MILDIMFMKLKLKHDTSKPIADTTNSEVDVVKLLQAYGMVNSNGSGLRHRKVKQIDINDISVQTSNFANDVHMIDLPSSGFTWQCFIG